MGRRIPLQANDNAGSFERDLSLSNVNGERRFVWSGNPCRQPVHERTVPGEPHRFVGLQAVVVN